jgi:hypothetical protein
VASDARSALGFDGEHGSSRAALGMSMTNDPDFDPDAIIDAVAPWLELTVDDASRPHVKTHLEIAARMAALLFEHQLDDREEPGPVFTS